MIDDAGADPADIARAAFIAACTLDVTTRKPGNVSIASAGHRMQAAQFLQSAAAAAAPLCAPGARVGARIEGAVRATRAVVQCNTNLGIVLLCAPLLAAAERWRPAAGSAALRVALHGVLAGLDVDDARAAYRAIAHAGPGGLGEAREQDVADAPTVGLRDAMALAADRDRIAWQYLHAHADVFELGLPALRSAHELPRTAGLLPEAAARRGMLRAFLEFLAAFPDSHIVRKHGPALAHSVMAQALPWRDRIRDGEDVERDPAFGAWDESLKAQGLNPGTSADLAVATALVATLCEPGIAQLGRRR